MNDFFKRQIELWGIEKQESLQNKTVVVIGSGGLGNSIAIGLGSVGIGKIYIVDFDEVSVSNIHRQLLFKQSDENKHKAVVVSEFLKEKSDYTEVIPLVMSFDEFENYYKTQNDDSKFNIDILIDATDNLHVRKKIDEFAKLLGLPWIYGSVEAFHGQVCFFENSSFDVFQISDKKPAGISAPMVMQVASFQANLALRYLLNEPVKKDFLYYLSYSDDGIFTTSGFRLPNHLKKVKKNLNKESEMLITKFEPSGNLDNLVSVIESIEAENIIIFSTDANNLTEDEYNQLILKFSVGKTIVGGVFPLVIFEKQHYEKGFVVIGLNTKMNVGIINNLSSSDGFVEDIEEFADADYEGDTNLIFVDGLSSNIGGFIDEVFNILGVFQNFIGGGAGSLSFEQKPVILTPDGIKQDCAIMINIDIKSFIGVNHGWKSISGPHQVTKAEKNRIIELDYKPALQVYKSVVEPHCGTKITNDNFFEIAKGYPFGINKFDSEKIVRDPIFLEDQTLVCVGEITQGDYVDILNGENELLINAAKKAKDISVDSLSKKYMSPDKKDTFALFIDCISRVLFLEDDFSKELENVSITDIPLVGALTLGEIANNGSDYLEFYNKTSVFGLLKK